MAVSAMALVRTPEEDPGHAELLAGLLSVPKTLPSKYLYDEEGSRLFELICDQPEYYVARTEISLLASIAADMAHVLNGRSMLVESEAARASRHVFYWMRCRSCPHTCLSTLARAPCRLLRRPSVANIPG